MTRKRKFGLWLSHQLEILAFKIDNWSYTPVKNFHESESMNFPMTSEGWEKYAALPEFEDGDSGQADGLETPPGINAPECNYNVHDDPRWCDTHEAEWPDSTKPCLSDELESIRRDDEEFKAAVIREAIKKAEKEGIATIYDMKNPNASWNAPK